MKEVIYDSIDSSNNGSTDSNSNSMIIEHNTYEQIGWLQEKYTEEQYLTDFHAWKIKNGYEDGKYPYAKGTVNNGTHLYNGPKNRS